jgi:hypothetical protein
MSLFSSIFTFGKHPMTNTPTTVQQPINVAADDLMSWLKIAIGTVLTFTDVQSLQDSQKQGRGMTGMDYKVEKVSCLLNAEGTNHWLFLWLTGDQDLVMLIKQAGNRTDKRVYMAVEDFKPGNRQDMIDNDQRWLFQAPEKESFDPMDLKYTNEIWRDALDSQLRYVIKSQREQHGVYSERPEGVGQLVATIVEYSTSDNTDNPEAFVLELGQRNSMTNIQFFIGAAIRNSEVKIA